MLVLEEDGFQFTGGGEFGAVGEDGCGVDRFAVDVLTSPASDGVVVFESETQGVDLCVTAGAFCFFPVDFQLLAEAESFG